MQQTIKYSNRMRREILFILLLLVISINGYAQKKFTFSANEPIGKAKGICPGRVTLAHDPKVAKWDGVNGHWWDEGQIDQERLDRMYDLSICSLANANTSVKAWRLIFNHYNKTHARGNAGYK